MQYCKLGKTDLKISVVGFGGIPIIRLDTNEAVKVLRHALDKGITFYDTANMYRDSEDKIGQAFAGLRTRVVLATKTTKRDAAGFVDQLDTSLRALKTDYIDLYQFHQVAKEAEWEAISSPGGALEAAVHAKKQGKIRHLGVSSHSLPMALKLVKTGLFETIQFPFNFIEDAACDELLAVAQELNVGFLAMKPFGGGVIDNSAVAFKFLRQYPWAIPIPGYDSFQTVNDIVAIYEQPNVVTTQDLAVMDEFRARLGRQFCRRCEYCLPCPNGVLINQAMMYPVLAKRMSPKVALEFSQKTMESVLQCTECGDCLTRCPYELDIPKILRSYYELYQQHQCEVGGRSQ